MHVSVEGICLKKLQRYLFLNIRIINNHPLPLLLLGITVSQEEQNPSQAEGKLLHIFELILCDIVSIHLSQMSQATLFFLFITIYTTIPYCTASWHMP